jgi:biopolymer transport protein TolR
MTTFETRHRRFMAEINVIPLVDVVLVLLVIFMVTAPMLYRGIDINLPKSATNTIKPETRAVLSIERDRRLFLDKDPVSPVQLERKLRTLKDQSSEVSVYLRADQDVPYGIVVEVMDSVKKAGIEKLGMVTDPTAGAERMSDQNVAPVQPRKK